MTRAANNGWSLSALGQTPKAKKIPSSQVVHGLNLVDDFAWMRDPKWQEVFRDTSILQKDIREYLEAENKYTEGAFAPYEPLKKKLIAEILPEPGKETNKSGFKFASAAFLKNREGKIQLTFMLQRPMKEENACALREKLLKGGFTPGK